GGGRGASEGQIARSRRVPRRGGLAPEWEGATWGWRAGVWREGAPRPSPFEPLPFGSGTSPAALIETSTLAGLSLLGVPFVGMKAMSPACVLTVTEAVPGSPIVAGRTPRLLVIQPCPPLAAPLPAP